MSIKNKKAVVVEFLIGLSLSIVGVTLIHYDYFAVGVFFMIWGNNVGR